MGSELTKLRHKYKAAVIVRDDYMEKYEDAKRIIKSQAGIIAQQSTELMHQRCLIETLNERLKDVQEKAADSE